MKVEESDGYCKRDNEGVILKSYSKKNFRDKSSH